MRNSRINTTNSKKRRSRPKYSWKIKSKFSNTSFSILEVQAKIRLPTEPLLAMKIHSMSFYSFAKATSTKSPQSLTTWSKMSKLKTT